MMRSNERASGIPWDIPLLLDFMDSLMEFCLSAPDTDSVEEIRETREGRR